MAVRSGRRDKNEIFRSAIYMLCTHMRPSKEEREKQGDVFAMIIIAFVTC
jgi:hypothetical protein